MNNFLFLPRAIAAAVSDTAFTIVFGLVIARLWLAYEGDDGLRGKLKRGAILGMAAVPLALGVQTYLLAATMAGAADIPSVRNQYAAVMTGTHAGLVLLYECGFSLLLFGLLLTRSGLRTRAGVWSVLAMLGILAAIRAATGHAAGDGDFTLPEFSQAVHLISTAIWAGCILVGGLLIVPALLHSDRPQATAQFMRPLSNTVTVALALIVLSGVYNSYRGLDGTLAPLIGTQWGVLLDVKLLLVGVALGLGVVNRITLQRRLELSEEQEARLSAILRVEAIVMLLILTVSAFLANSPPATGD